MNHNFKLLNNPKLYEINTRVWVKKFSPNARLNDVPLDYWNELKELGIEYVWLMGVWEINKNTIEEFCFEEGLAKEYSEALPGWTKDDVIGSPFSIEDYKVNPALGTKEDLTKLKETLNSLGLKLILDFIPNHFSAESYLLKAHPEIFLQGTEEDLTNNPSFFIKGNKIFAHGKDPNFPSWKDTAQVNYFSTEARKFMMSRLISISELCDGVRCDMAMLVVNSVFKNTWSETISKYNLLEPKAEFWKTAINSVKEDNPDFIFIAETYWDMEWQLQELGFDFTYDKKLLDRLKQNDVIEIKNHLLAGDEFQKRSVRFLENHDEKRSVEILGRERSKAAAVIISTLPGMKLYYDGQLEGYKIKLPVQLGREPDERIAEDVKAFYKKLFSITSQSIFGYGSWHLLEPLPAWEGGKSYVNILAWQWTYDEQRKVVVVNFAEKSSHCSLIFNPNGNKGEFILKDELNDIDYIRSSAEIMNIGLYVKLGPYQSHIFSF